MEAFMVLFIREIFSFLFQTRGCLTRREQVEGGLDGLIFA